MLVFGAYAFISGVFGLVSAFTGPNMQGRGWLIVSSLAGIAVGVVCFVLTGCPLALCMIGAYAIILGLITIGGAFCFR